MVKESLKFALNPMNTIFLFLNDNAPSGLVSIRMIAIHVCLFMLIVQPTSRSETSYSRDVWDYVGGRSHLIFAFGDIVTNGKITENSSSKWDRMIRIKPTLKGVLFSPIYYFESTMYYTSRFTGLSRWQIWMIVSWIVSFCWAFEFKNGKVKSSTIC